MRNKLFITDTELEQYGEIGLWSDKLQALLEQQKHSWEMLGSNYDNLSNVETTTLEIKGFKYRIQFNPGRIVSSSAKVDEKSIRERVCFLCPGNLPEGQRGLKYGNDYIILCNPFPIFTEHFTIVHVRHTPQEIRTTFPVLLQLSEDLKENYALLYNGPKCGASAPDHLHFQAGNRGFLPLAEEYERAITKVGVKVADKEGLLIFAVDDGLRRFLSFECDDASLLTDAFGRFYAAAQKTSGKDEEPLMNIISSFEDGEWRVIIFPRAKHRPSVFFAEGEKRMLVSPAAVDMAGVITVPIEKDFRRMSAERVVEIFDEVVLSQKAFSDLVRELSEEVARQ